MKSHVRKLIFILLTVCIISTCFFQCFALSREENIDIIKQSGFVPENLDSMNDTAIEKLAEFIKKAQEPKEPVKVNEFGYPEDFYNALSESTQKKIVSSIGDYIVSDVDCGGSKDMDRAISYVVAELRDRKTGKYAGESVCVYWEWFNKTFIGEEFTIAADWNPVFFAMISILSMSRTIGKKPLMMIGLFQIHTPHMALRSALTVTFS